jgi:hypothetical protein
MVINALRLRSSMGLPISLFYRFTVFTLGAGLGVATAQTPVGAAEDAAPYVKMLEDLPANQCANNRGKQVLMQNTHPSRTLRVWMERYHMGQKTADRSRTDLKPGSEPDPLGCSRSDTGPQEWRLVKAIFVD